MALSDTLSKMFMGQQQPQTPDPNMLGSGMANQAGMILELNKKIKAAYLSGDDETAMQLQEMLRQMTQSPTGVQMPPQGQGPGVI